MALSAKKAKLDEILGSSLRDMSARQFREVLMIIGPVILLCAGAIWLALQFVKPAPPAKIAISTGGAAGGYFAFGQKYAAHLKRNGISLEVRPSAGSIENIERLKDPASGVGAALVQGGISNSRESPGLVSLGRLFPEPLWVFYRGDEQIDRLHQLKGKRIAVGPEGSGTRQLAMALLGPNEISAQSATLSPSTGMEAADALEAGSLDAVFLALAPQAAVVQKLMRSKNVRLMSLAQAEAYTRLFPYLQRIVLPQGAVDLVGNIPPYDVSMIAPVAALVVREDLHPAVVGLLIDAAREAHAGGGLFHRVGDFPRPLDPEYEMNDDAERYYKAGPSFLKRHLPFWLATFIERMSVIAVPLAGAMLPLLKVGPMLYKWRIRRRLFYWYGRLKALEASVSRDRSPESLDEFRAEVTRIDEAVNTIPVPIGFADQYYSLRAAIDLVRQRLLNQAAVVNASMG